LEATKLNEKPIISNAAVTFGTRLKMLREQKKLSMAELAATLNTTIATISRYENGKIMPTLDSAKKFAEFFMVTVDWIAGGGDESDIMASVPQIYIDAVKYAMYNDVSAEQLKKAVDLIKGE
jgi:transcriptional regulator with XRE-family HTH domain